MLLDPWHKVMTLQLMCNCRAGHLAAVVVHHLQDNAHSACPCLANSSGLKCHACPSSRRCCPPMHLSHALFRSAASLATCWKAASPHRPHQSPAPVPCQLLSLCRPPGDAVHSCHCQLLVPMGQIPVWVQWIFSPGPPGHGLPLGSLTRSQCSQARWLRSGTKWSGLLKRCGHRKQHGRRRS